MNVWVWQFATGGGWAKRPCYLVEGRPEPLQAVGIERA
jgi:hypothetical protein